MQKNCLRCGRFVSKEDQEDYEDWCEQCAEDAYQETAAEERVLDPFGPLCLNESQQRRGWQ